MSFDMFQQIRIVLSYNMFNDITFTTLYLCSTTSSFSSVPDHTFPQPRICLTPMMSLTTMMILMILLS